MTRTSWPAAAFAVTLAFGVGYAVRLACAWSAGPTQVVEGGSVESTPSSEAATPRESPRRGAPSPPPQESRSEGAPVDADRGNGASPAPGESFRKAMYETFARHERTADYRRAVDAVAVAPLGRTPEQLGLLDAGGVAPAPLVESVTDVRLRLSSVNADGGPPTDGDFQLAAFRRGGRFEVVLGAAGLPRSTDPTGAAALLASRSGKSLHGGAPSARPDMELTSDQSLALVRSCAESHRDTEAARRALWSRLHELAASGEAKPLDPREVVGVCVARGRCFVVRVGDDPELDRLVDEADRLERTVRAEVEFELRR